MTTLVPNRVLGSAAGSGAGAGSGSGSGSVSGTVRALAVAVVAGLALGVGDLVWMTHVPYPWAPVANLSAVWALAAYLLGAVLRTDPARAAVAGVVMLLVAVEAYYGYAGVTHLGDLSTMWSPTARTWLVFAVLAGAAFGVAGAWSAGGAWWRRVLGTALGAGVLLGEAVHIVGATMLAFGPQAAPGEGPAWILAALGVGVLLLSARRPSVLLAAAVATVPAAGFCAMAFAAAGISF